MRWCIPNVGFFRLFSSKRLPVGLQVKWKPWKWIKLWNMYFVLLRIEGLPLSPRMCPGSQSSSSASPSSPTYVEKRLVFLYIKNKKKLSSFLKKWTSFGDSLVTTVQYVFATVLCSSNYNSPPRSPSWLRTCTGRRCSFRCGWRSCRSTGSCRLFPRKVRSLYCLNKNNFNILPFSFGRPLASGSHLAECKKFCWTTNLKMNFFYCLRPGFPVINLCWWQKHHCANWWEIFIFLFFELVYMQGSPAEAWKKGGKYVFANVHPTSSPHKVGKEEEQINTISGQKHVLFDLMSEMYTCSKKCRCKTINAIFVHH